MQKSNILVHVLTSLFTELINFVFWYTCVFNVVFIFIILTPKTTNKVFVANKYKNNAHCHTKAEFILSSFRSSVFDQFLQSFYVTVHQDFHTFSASMVLNKELLANSPFVSSFICP